MEAAVRHLAIETKTTELPDEDSFDVFVRVRTVAETNRSRHEPWYVTKKRVDEQHDAVAYALRGRSSSCPWRPPLHVLMTRHSAGELDDFENLPSALKAVADAVAYWVMGSQSWAPKERIGLADRFKSLISFEARQQRCARGDFGVHIEIRRRRV